MLPKKVEEAEQRLLYDWNDVLNDVRNDVLNGVGGAMGLFLGFSLLSIAECLGGWMEKVWRRSGKGEDDKEEEHKWARASRKSSAIDN